MKLTSAQRPLLAPAMVDGCKPPAEGMTIEDMDKDPSTTHIGLGRNNISNIEGIGQRQRNTVSDDETDWGEDGLAALGADHLDSNFNRHLDSN